MNVRQNQYFFSSIYHDDRYLKNKIQGFFLWHYSFLKPSNLYYPDFDYKEFYIYFLLLSNDTLGVFLYPISGSCIINHNDSVCRPFQVSDLTKCGRLAKNCNVYCILFQCLSENKICQFMADYEPTSQGCQNQIMLCLVWILYLNQWKLTLLQFSGPGIFLNIFDYNMKMTGQYTSKL